VANYTPPSGDNVVLNFKDLTTGSTELNFGVDSGTEPVAITVTLDAVIDTSFLSAINALFDINFVLGVSQYPAFQYQKAAPIRVDQIYPWAKPIFKAHNNAFIFELGLTLSNTALTGFNNSLVLSQSIQQVFQQSQSLPQNCSAIWQENK
jgi:hypothetical protein